MDPTPAPPAYVQARATSGIAGLDNVLGGGFPSGHLYLIEGTPGCGKTTLGLQFLIDGLQQGEAGLYVTLSETREELAIVAESHGWSLAGLEVFELVSEEGLSPAAEQSILYPSQVELGETTRAVMDTVRRVHPARVVFDSLSEMRLLAQDPLRYRRQILALKHFFAAQRCTVLMLDDRNGDGDGETRDLQLHSIAHGVVQLEQSMENYGPVRRHLRIVKMRGVRYRGGEHDMDLVTGGLRVFPRLIAAEHRREAAQDMVSCGHAALDALLGGGLPRGCNTLLLGPSGVGKTTTAMTATVAALRRGEKVVFYIFDEGLNTLMRRCRALGMPVDDAIASGQLELRPLDPGEISPGHFTALVREAVEERGVSLVVIDSLNAYLQAMPGAKFLLLQMHELLNYLNQKGIVSLLVLGQHGLMGEVRTDLDLSYLSDTIVLFRYFEARGQLLKAVSVVKSRATQPELSIREFRLTAGRGVEVGDALEDFVGVLGGVPTYDGRAEMMGEADARRRRMGLPGERAGGP